MIVRKKLRQICLDKDMDLSDVAEKFGITAESFYVKMSRNTMKINDVEKMADALDCDIVFRDRKTGKIY